MRKNILELQASLLESNADIVSQLRQAHVFAFKLNLSKFDKWIQYELNGYPNDDGNDFPKYRILRGEAKAKNPLYGWIPIIFDESNLCDIVCNRKIVTPLPELVQLVQTSSGPLKINIPDHMVASLCGYNEVFPCAVIFGKSQVESIIHCVHNILLNWTLELEKQGIIGENLIFSQNETSAAQTTPQSINNYYYVNVVQGNVMDSSLISGSKNKVIFNYDSVKQALHCIKSEIQKEENISQEDNKHILESIDNINSAIQNSENPSVIRKLMIALKDFAIQAGAALTADVIGRHIGNLF
jgi:hypothetical protein